VETRCNRASDPKIVVLLPTMESSNLEALPSRPSPHRHRRAHHISGRPASVRPLVLNVPKISARNERIWQHCRQNGAAATLPPPLPQQAKPLHSGRSGEEGKRERESEESHAMRSTTTPQRNAAHRRGAPCAWPGFAFRTEGWRLAGSRCGAAMAMGRRRAAAAWHRDRVRVAGVAGYVDL